MNYMLSLKCSHIYKNYKVRDTKKHSQNHWVWSISYNWGRVFSEPNISNLSKSLYEPYAFHWTFKQCARLKITMSILLSNLHQNIKPLFHILLPSSLFGEGCSLIPFLKQKKHKNILKGELKPSTISWCCKTNFVSKLVGPRISNHFS